MKKFVKQLSEELIGVVFSDWIELDNKMIGEGFASNESCDWDEILNDENVVYIYEENEGVQLYFRVVDEGIKITGIFKW